MMNQTLLALDDTAADPLDRVGFDIGWDHARHALVPPPQLMLSGTPVSQGWSAGRAVFGQRTLVATRAVRQWLELRLHAWREGISFEDQQLTPHHLAQLEVTHCPVTRRALGGPGTSATAPVVMRLRDDAGYAAGNLAVVSRQAALARGRLGAQASAELARRLERDGLAAADGLDQDAWARLAALLGLAAQGSHADAARLPLRVLPPNRVRVLNPVQGLQVLLTLRLQAAGWSRRARAIAELLPRPGLRHDFILFVGALAARLMTIPVDATAQLLRWGQEDAWACGRVQRRWAHLALQLTAAECEGLVQRLADGELGGVKVLVHADDGATDGWALASAGRLLSSPRAARRQSGMRSRPPVNSSAMSSPKAW